MSKFRSSSPANSRRESAYVHPLLACFGSGLALVEGMRLSSPALLAPLVAIAVTASGCRAIEGIFKAGVWVGIIVVVLVGALFAALLGAVRR